MKRSSYSMPFFFKNKTYSFFECLFAMMLPLVPDVTDRISIWEGPTAECAVALLPEAVS